MDIRRGQVFPMLARPAGTGNRVHVADDWEKVKNGVQKLGQQEGICGLKWDLDPLKESPKVKKFIGLMRRFPVATNDAFKHLWGSPQAWDELLELFSLANNIHFNNFKEHIQSILKPISLKAEEYMPDNHVGILRAHYMGFDSFTQETIRYKNSSYGFKLLKDYPGLYLGISGVDIKNLSEPVIRALFELAQKHNITGKIIIRKKFHPFPLLTTNPHGRDDLHVNIF